MTPGTLTLAEVRRLALIAHNAGLCVVPPKEDGTKAPLGDWKEYQSQRPNESVLNGWYSNSRTGLGLVCGDVSGNLEVLEFDDPPAYQNYKELAVAVGLEGLIERVEAGYCEESPSGGVHWLYRCEQISGNTKLARRPKRPEEMTDPNDKIKTLIETRGEGGFIITAPSYGKVHPTGQPYQLLTGGFESIATISPEERASFFDLARAFDHMPKQTIQEPPNRDPGTSGLRPGDDLNARGDWANVLESHGWRLVFQRDGVGYWRRPGKNGGVSATTNYQGSDLLYVFSSSTPFETERGYSKFSAYALLEHNNDYAAAARALVGMGYGDPQTGANGHHTNGRQEVPEHDIAQAGGHQPAESDTPILPADVWTGWLSAYRDWVLPTTDGSIEGMFGAASVQLGIAIGRNVSIHYGVPTFANLFVALCGPTGVPRKTTLINRTQSVQDWAFTGDFLRVVRSIGSGEGLLERFCQEIEEGEGKNKRTVLAPIPGQRVLLDEPELTNLLKKMRRPGTANIAEILLGLFDGVDYSPNTRRRPIVVQEPFFSIITATTPEALESTLNDVDIDSGLIPRVATFWCTPREPIAYPPAPDQAQLSALASTLQDVARFAEQLHQHDPNLQLSQDARHEWETIYRDLVKETRAAPKAVAGIMARVPTMVMKWALLYAVQGFHAIIEVDDLARAVMVGDYLMKTARLVPQHVEKIPIARIENRILDGMAKAPEKWWRPKDIDQKVGGRISAPSCGGHSNL